LSEVVSELAFSPDGRHLAAGLSADNGVRVWDAASGRLLGEDSDYGAASYGLDWHGGDLLASSCDDGQVRLHRLGPEGLRLVRSVSTTGGEEPCALRFSPD